MKQVSHDAHARAPEYIGAFKTERSAASRAAELFATAGRNREKFAHLALEECRRDAEFADAMMRLGIQQQASSLATRDRQSLLHIVAPLPFNATRLRSVIDRGISYFDWQLIGGKRAGDAYLEDFRASVNARQKQEDGVRLHRLFETKVMKLFKPGKTLSQSCRADEIEDIARKLGVKL